MSDLREIFVVVHPGSALGSANMNLGKFIAEGARSALEHAFDSWTGPSVVIHGELSDELPHYPQFAQALNQMVNRSQAHGHVVATLVGDDESEHNQEEAIKNWVTAQGLVPGEVRFRVTGAWYHSSDGGGCVGSVIDQLKALGHTAQLDEDSVLDLDADELDEELDDEFDDELEEEPEVDLPPSDRASAPREEMEPAPFSSREPLPLPSDWPVELEATLARMKSAGFTGFGDQAPAAALALADALFPHQQVAFAGAFNRALHERSEFVGHVAIALPGETGLVYLDADGWPKTWEEIQSWGILPTADSDLIPPTHRMALTRDEQVAEDVIQVNLTRQDLEAMSSPELIARMRDVVRPAAVAIDGETVRPRRRRPS